MENEFCYQKLINEYILDKLAEGKVSEEVIAGLLRIIYAICSNMSIEFKKMKLKKDYNESGIVIRIEESEEEEEKKENENKDINQEFVREEEKKKEDEVKIEAPRRYLPVRCSDCAYKIFIDEQVKLGNIKKEENETVKEQ